MTNIEKTEYIDKLVTIAYYWLSEENYHCSISIYKLLKKLTLNKQEKERVENLKSDIETMSKNKNILNTVEELQIPEPCKTEEDKLLWIILTTLMNLFNSGNFEMGFMFLNEFTQSWNDIYINMIALLKGSEFKEELINWAMTYFFFAQDLVGKEEFSRLGYKIEKI